MPVTVPVYQQQQVGVGVPNPPRAQSTAMDFSPLAQGIIGVGQAISQSEREQEAAKNKAQQELDDAELMKFKSVVQTERQKRIDGPDGYKSLLGEQIKTRPNVVPEFESFVRSVKDQLSPRVKLRAIGIEGDELIQFRKSAWGHAGAQAVKAQQDSFNALNASSTNGVFLGIKNADDEAVINSLGDIDAATRISMRGKADENTINQAVRENHANALTKAAELIAESGDPISAARAIQQWGDLADPIVMAEWAAGKKIVADAEQKSADIDALTQWEAQKNLLLKTSDNPATTQNENDYVRKAYDLSVAELRKLPLTDAQKQVREKSLKGIFDKEVFDRNSHDAQRLDILGARLYGGEPMSPSMLKRDPLFLEMYDNGRSDAMKMLEEFRNKRQTAGRKIQDEVDDMADEEYAKLAPYSPDPKEQTMANLDLDNNPPSWFMAASTAKRAQIRKSAGNYRLISREKVISDSVAQFSSASDLFIKTSGVADGLGEKDKEKLRYYIQRRLQAESESRYKKNQRFMIEEQGEFLDGLSKEKKFERKYWIDAKLPEVVGLSKGMTPAEEPQETEQEPMPEQPPAVVAPSVQQQPQQWDGPPVVWVELGRNVPEGYKKTTGISASGTHYKAVKK